MSQIFISYAKQDSDYASELKAHLDTLGHSSWWFDNGINPGEKWQESILKALQDTDALVVLVSTASKNSQWINHELGAAFAYAEEKGRPVIIPVFLEPVVTS